MYLTLYELRLVLVVILCIPIVYFGIRFTGSLIDQAVAGKKKTGSEGKKSRRKDQTELTDQADMDDLDE